MHEYDAQGWNIHAVCYAFIPLQWPTVKQRINRERERENLWFRLKAVYHQTGVTVSDVTPLVLFIKPVPGSLSTRDKGLL